MSQQISIIGLWSEFINIATFPAHLSFMTFTAFKDDIAESKSSRIEKSAILNVRLNNIIIRTEKIAPSFDDPNTLSLSVSKMKLKIEETGQLEFEILIDGGVVSTKSKIFLINNSNNKES